MIVVTGDLNAEEGRNNVNREEVMGKFGVGVMNDDGKRLRNLSGTNGLAVTGTFLPHKRILKLTWKSESISMERGLQQQKRPLRMVETRNYTA